MKISAIKDKVLIELDHFEEKDGLIFIPDKYKSKPMWGTVRSCGSRATVDVGDRVLIPWATGNDLKINKKLFVFVHDNEIMAVQDG